MPTSSQPSDHWHLDKKVPITLIVGLLLQAAAGLWFAARVVERDEAQERRIERMEQDQSAANTGGRVAVLEAQQAALLDRLKTMDGKLDRLIERERPR